MHAYLATICRDLGAELVRIDGVADHVHVVTTLPRTTSHAEFIEQIKKVSSKWIKELDPRYRGFFWQRGYGAFSIGPSQLDMVLRYLQTQKSTIALGCFRRSIASCCANTALISTSAMSGTKASAVIESRFQRLSLKTDFSWGVAPGFE